MPQPKAASDHTVDQIHELKDRLEECLTDAERVRARLSKAHEANHWPDLREVVVRLLTDNDPRGH